MNMSFLCFGGITPPLLESPKKAPNGILVAHPVDLCAMKLKAAGDRSALRDYQDLAEITVSWPDHLDRAIDHLAHRAHMPKQQSFNVLVHPTREIAEKISGTDFKKLHNFVKKRDRGLGR